MINYDFKDKNVIVTGASMGLGYAIALEFVKAKANVIIADINIDEALKAKEKLESYGTKVEAYKIDVSKYDEFVDLTNYVVNKFGSIDIVFIFRVVLYFLQTYINLLIYNIFLQ